MKVKAGTLAAFLIVLPAIATPVKAQDAYAACFNKARGYNLTEDEIVIACQGATSSTAIASCMDNAWRFNLRGTQIANACRKARSNTDDCIQSAWSNNLRGNQIVEVCKTTDENCQCNCPATTYEYIQPRPIIIKPYPRPW